MNVRPDQSQRTVWQRAVSDIDALAATVRILQQDRATTLARLQEALRDIQERMAALHLLSFLDADYVIALTDTLVSLSLSHGDALAVREVLGGLPHDKAVRTVPAAIWKQLGETDDDDAYRRLAELLRHLGLGTALRELCERALASDDPAVREVAEDFGSWA